MEKEKQFVDVELGSSEILVTQSRWRSKYVWIGLFSIVAFVLGNYGLYDAIGMTSEALQTLFNLILSFLISVGVVNNGSFKDKW